MPRSMLRLLALGLLGLGAAAVIGGNPLQWRSALAAGGEAPAETAAPDTAGRADGSVRVDAPHAKVLVDKERGRVSVEAPYTDVKVDPDKGRVRVRAPYVDLDIRW